MKKVLALLLALALLLSAAALAETTEETIVETTEETVVETEPEKVDITPGKVVGEWFAEYAKYSDTTYYPTNTIKLTINRNKSGLLVWNDQEYSLKWTIENKSSLKLNLDEADIFHYAPAATMSADGTLSFENLKDSLYEFPTYIFTRENKTLPLPEAVAADLEDDFYGNYKLAYTMIGKLAILPNEDQAVNIRVDFAEAEFDINSDNEVYVTEFADGVLVIDITPERSYQQKNILRLSSESSIVKLSKTTDEKLYLATVSNAAGEIAASYYLIKAD